MSFFALHPVEYLFSSTYGGITSYYSTGRAGQVLHKHAPSLYPSQAGLFASGEITEHTSMGVFGGKKRHPYHREQRSFIIKAIIACRFA